MIVIDILSSYWGLIGYVAAIYIIDIDRVSDWAWFKYVDWYLARADRNRARRECARPAGAIFDPRTDTGRTT